ncbi:DUF421 domain-containing protein [Paracoccus aerius]|uniref:DUF421 domain-containing protein n=1 Tax=Paracoccus aerius TaxID=1915382 RepID=A0ABS1S443_9RHOB|nr:YetF domain-containing protein [Paracoccus aerius]MBL3673478.1 DUF421 domain-containing protein [Paracoccus aerius]GHG19935.1 DUF421 domain-containing protein [Paracoccus aerius]
MDQPIFFDTWASLGRVILVGTLAYAGLVVMLRVSGKRTLSKMNAFDLIVTVALGSTLATVLLNRSVPLVEGLAAFALLVGLQYVITWLSVRSDQFQDLIKAEPTVLISKGKPVPGALTRQRVTMEEIRAAMRQSGHAELNSDITVVLETDGSLSILAHGGDG